MGKRISRQNLDASQQQSAQHRAFCLDQYKDSRCSSSVFYYVIDDTLLLSFGETVILNNKLIETKKDQR